MLKELIYDKINGFLADGIIFMSEGSLIEDEFAEGKECCVLYESVYQAKQNLCRRLEEDENRDIETILDSMEKIARLTAMKMYDYGRCEGGIEIFIWREGI